MSGFKLNAKQQEAQILLAGPATHLMLFGGSRSGKTFLHMRNVCMRALKAPESRHAVMRFRFNAVKSSVVLDTFPKVMKLCFPGVRYTMNKTDWFAEFENGSQIWFGGLDDKERTEKILGMEFATIYLNECSQIPWGSVGVAVTRLAQKAEQVIDGKASGQLQPRMYYDCNPPSKAHWTYRLFIEKRDPDTRAPLADPDNYGSFRINPVDNVENLSTEYLKTLESLSERQKRRFLRGEFADATPNAIFQESDIDNWRVADRSKVPDLARVVIGVDPSGADDSEGSDNDAVGIIVAGLGVDGVAYVLGDLTVKAGPARWASIVGQAYDNEKADIVVGEGNYGGAMVEHVIRTARPKINFRLVNASRGKVVRAEPFSPLYEQGKVRHVGCFPELEDELSAFSTSGYTGERSPNRADALVWALTELFPEIIKPVSEPRKPKARGYVPASAGGWMN